MKDAHRLTALMQASSAYRGPYAAIIAGYQVRADYIARHEVFVAVDEARNLLGFYALLTEPPELDLAFVADDVRGQGVGRRLIEHMMGQARQAGATHVRVVSHPPAEDFYLRMGAERVGTVRPAPPRITWERPELRFTPA